MSKNLYKKAVIFAALFVFVALHVTFIWSLRERSHDPHTQSAMTGCLFMKTEKSLCPMNIVDHINQWKNMTVMVKAVSWTEALTLIILSTLIAWCLRYKGFLRQKNAIPIGHSFIQRIKEAMIRSSFYLIYLFSQGILHPKLFPNIVESARN